MGPWRQRVHPEWIVLLVFSALSLILYKTHGHRNEGLIYATFILFALSVTLLGKFTTFSSVSHLALKTRLIVILCGVGALLEAINPQLLYAKPNPALDITLWIRVGCIAGALINHQKAQRLFLGAAIVLSFSAQGLVLIASPQPLIDVFTSTQYGLDALMQGENPYTLNYADIYSGEFSYRPGWAYWPGTIGFFLPGHLIGPDHRLSLIIANLIFVLCLFLGARFAKWKTASALALGLLWLCTPVRLFVLEQSWIDGLVIACLGLFSLALHYRRSILMGLSIGMALVTKQTVILVALGLLPGVYQILPRREFWRAVGTALVVMGVFIGGALSFNAHAFINITILEPTKYAARTDAFTVTAQILRANHLDLSWLALPIGLGTYGILWWRGRSATTHVRRWLPLAFAHFGFFLFAKQAFCNYYDFVNALLLLSLPSLTEQTTSSARVE